MESKRNVRRALLQPHGLDFLGVDGEELLVCDITKIELIAKVDALGILVDGGCALAGLLKLGPHKHVGVTQIHHRHERAVDSLRVNELHI